MFKQFWTFWRLLQPSTMDFKPSVGKCPFRALLVTLATDSNHTWHGSSEGHEMLKRNDKYHSIADDVPIPKM